MSSVIVRAPLVSDAACVSGIYFNCAQLVFLSAAMALCGRCGEESLDTIQCSVCHKNYDFPCSGITEKGYRKLGDRQATWRCASCKSQNLSGTASPAAPITPVGSTSPCFTLDSVMRELSCIRQELAPIPALTSELQIIRKELTELKGLSSKVQNIDARLTKVEESQEDIAELKSTVVKLEDELQDTEQWLRSNNVEIKGVPLKDRENLFEIIGMIGEKITYQVQRSQINFVHRVPTNDPKNKNIIVSFICRYVKEDFIAAFRSHKDPLTPKDIGISGPGRIYVNDHLTVKNKKLLSRAKSLAKEKGYQYVWVKHMKIFVRRDPTTKTFVIERERDILKIR